MRAAIGSGAAGWACLPIAKAAARMAAIVPKTTARAASHGSPGAELSLAAVVAARHVADIAGSLGQHRTAKITQLQASWNSSGSDGQPASPPASQSSKAFYVVDREPSEQ